LDSGFSEDPAFNQFLTVIREIQRNGLPASSVGDTFAQLLAMDEPPANVVVAKPFAPQSVFIESTILTENTESAVRFSCG
jgi:hypothetical protein